MDQGDLTAVFARLRQKSPTQGSSQKRGIAGRGEQVDNALAEKRRGYNLAQRLQHPKHVMLRKAKTRANRTGIKISITVDDVEWPEFCPVLGCKLLYGAVGGGRGWPNSASLDRIDNSKGYVPGNVAVISLRANCIKRDATLEELERLVIYLRGYQNAGSETL